jgi:hypothetical protein
VRHFAVVDAKARSSGRLVLAWVSDAVQETSPSSMRWSRTLTDLHIRGLNFLEQGHVAPVHRGVTSATSPRIVEGVVAQMAGERGK